MILPVLNIELLFTWREACLKVKMTFKNTEVFKSNTLLPMNKYYK